MLILIGDCIRAGRLYRVPSLLPGASQARTILATPQLMAGLTGTGAEARRRMVVELRADLDTFIMGMAVTVGGPRHNAYMKPLARTRDERGFSNHEVWEIRSLDPEPSIRVFGRFAMKDVFVATDWELRTSLGAFGSLEWRREIRRCKSDWRKLFDTRAPHSGVTVNDYISDPVIDLRDP